MEVYFHQEWAMPSADTFSVLPIKKFVEKYINKSKVSIDPFARNFILPTYTNDLNTETKSQYHLDAVEFLQKLGYMNVKADLGIIDPPYSPRQISECYKSVGRKVGMRDTQSANLYKSVRDSFLPLLSDDSIVLSFGWNTVGMGKKRGFEIIEIMLVCHGGAHNDIICMAEKRIF